MKHNVSVNMKMECPIGQQNVFALVCFVISSVE